MIVMTPSSAGMGIAEIPGTRVCVQHGSASQRSIGGSGKICTQIAILSALTGLLAMEVSIKFSHVTRKYNRMRNKIIDR